MPKVDTPVDGLYADTAGDHVAWCVEGSNAALTAVNSIIGNAVYAPKGVRLMKGARSVSHSNLAARCFLPCVVHEKTNDGGLQPTTRPYSYY